MDALRDIIYILDRYKVRHVEVLTNTPNSPASQENRYFELYAGLRDGRWGSEAEAARHFGYDAAGKGWTRFKNEVKKRLYNTVLFIDISLPDFTDYNRAYATLNQQLAVAKTLAARGAKKSSVELFYRILEVALKFEYLEIAVDILDHLRLAIVAFPPYNKNYLRIKELHQFYFEAYLTELKVRDAYEGFLYPLSMKKGYKRDLAAQVRQIVAELKPVVSKQPYIRTQFMFRLLEVYSYLLGHEWEAGLAVCEEALSFARSKPFEPRNVLSALLHQKAAALIMLNRFDAAGETLRELLDLTQEGQYAWFKTFELQMVNHFYAGEYQNAWKIFKSISKHPRFGELPQTDQETWCVYQGYLAFLVKSGVLSLSPREKGFFESFRLSRWLNDLPLFSQDKRGANIPVLIAQSLFLLLENRIDEFDNRAEALRKYRLRNLDTEHEHYRTDCFIRMIELIPRHHYRPKAIASAAQKWLDKMESISTDILDRSYELEIVPYERQWQWILDLLKRI